MTEQQQGAGLVPQFTAGDRYRKAREILGLDQTQFADEIGVSRQTVSNYERDLVKPRRIVERAWALRTGVPIDWLQTGQTHDNPRPGGPDGGIDADQCAIKDSNLEPAGLESPPPPRSVVVPLRRPLTSPSQPLRAAS